MDIDLNHLQRNHWIFCNVQKLQFPVAVESFKDTILYEERMYPPESHAEPGLLSCPHNGKLNIFIRFKLYELQVASGC